MNLQKQNMNEQLSLIRNQIIDIALIFASVLGLITYLVSIYKLLDSHFRITHITDLLMLLTIMLVAVYRRRISLKIKGIIILIVLFFVIFVDVLQLGLLSANKVFIVLIPFFALTVFSLKRTLVIFFLAMTIFSVIGWLIITDQNLLLVENENHIKSVEAWVINGLIILITTFVTLLITQGFNRAYLQFIKDISKKNSELSVSEQKYRNIFEGSADAIFIHAQDGSLLSVNSSMLEMFGYDEEDTDSLSFESLMLNDELYNIENAKTYIKAAFSEGDQVFDWIAKKKNGVLFWVEVTLKKFTDKDGDRVLAFVRDIHEKKEMTLQLEEYKSQLESLVKKRTIDLHRSNKDLRNANKQLHDQKEELTVALDKLKSAQEKLIQKEKMASLGILTSGVGHEINNPLNFIQTGLYSIDTFFEDNRDCNDICENKNQLLKIKNMMQTGVDRMNSIVSGLNQFSRQSQNYDEICNIHSIIENCLVILNNQYKHRIEIILNYCEDELKIRGNSGKLHQAFTNILVNSIHAIKEKGVIIIETTQTHAECSITISDNGEGIDKKNLGKIFDPFFSTKKPGEGTGLGLSITYGIINDHRGTIQYFSEKGEGTKVQIKLPKTNINEQKQ
jgi:PAS domain S-box-containing protein